MRRILLFAASSILLACCALAIAFRWSWAAAPNQSSADRETWDGPADESPLIVHEWGTFTSFSGSDGVKLEYRPLVDNDLPAFVKTIRPSFAQLLSKGSIRAIQRMETPVTYFYTPVERDVTVKVEFPEGLLTEYFPPVLETRPEPTLDPFPPQDPPARPDVPLKHGLLNWGQVHLIPTKSLRAHVEDEELARRIGRQVEQLMVEPAGTTQYRHYVAARETDSAIVQVRQGTAPQSTDYFEKFLFYRGIGNFELPLTLSEADDGTFQLINAGDDEVRSVFLVTVRGREVRFHRYDAATPHSTMSLRPSTDATGIDNLAEAMVTALIEEGLYEKEARAMVTCWRSSWFGEDGTRLLYMVPPSITRTLLPLQVRPQPDELVRVLVGRMEIMSTSQERHILQLVKSSAAGRLDAANANSDFRSPSLEDLLALGRLAEPALVRVQHIADDEQLRAEAKRLIDELRPATN